MPVSVRCTCESTNPGATRAPRRSMISMEESAIEDAACSDPTQATVSPSTTMAVASGSAAEYTEPLRYRTTFRSDGAGTVGRSVIGEGSWMGDAANAAYTGNCIFSGVLPLVASEDGGVGHNTASDQ